MLRSILADIIGPQPDMEIVGNSATTTSLAEAAEREDADIVILARDSAAQGEEYVEVLCGHSRPKVIEISSRGRYGSLYELRPCQVPLGEMSPRRLLEAIRGSLGAVPRADR
jgi:DNA-binding NarL/FixJ family response regulator